MRPKQIAPIVLCCALAVGCAERDPRPEFERDQDAVPVGVDVAPPRGAPETGSMTVPGQDPDQPLIVGEEGDTVQ